MRHNTIPTQCCPAFIIFLCFLYRCFVHSFAKMMMSIRTKCADYVSKIKYKKLKPKNHNLQQNKNWTDDSDGTVFFFHIIKQINRNKNENKWMCGYVSIFFSVVVVDSVDRLNRRSHVVRTARWHIGERSRICHFSNLFSFHIRCIRWVP